MKYSLKLNQKGSAIVVAALVFVIILATGAAVWYVIANNSDATKQNTNASNSNDTSGETGSDQSSSLLATYQSTRGAFTFSYPKSWIITGYRDGKKLDKIDGDEDHIRFQQADEATSKVDNYGFDITLAANAPGDAAWPMYPNGSLIEELKNGIDIWEDNQVQTLQKGRAENNCPGIRVASNDAFGFQLKNGKWLAATGSFCWTQGLSTSFSYAQQRDSVQFGQTIELLRSLKQN